MRKYLIVGMLLCALVVSPVFAQTTLAPIPANASLQQLLTLLIQLQLQLIQLLQQQRQGVVAPVISTAPPVATSSTPVIPSPVVATTTPVATSSPTLPVAAAPTVSLSLNSTLGGTVNVNVPTGTNTATGTLSWSTSGASTCLGSWIGSTPLNGVQAVTFDQDTTFTLTCTGSGGTTAKSLTAHVVRPPQTQSGVTVTSPNGGEVYYTNQTITVSWTGADASYISIVKLTTGSEPVSFAEFAPSATGNSAQINLANLFSGRIGGTGTNFKIKLVGYKYGGQTVTDESDGYFSILTAQ